MSIKYEIERIVKAYERLEAANEKLLADQKAAFKPLEYAKLITLPDEPIIEIKDPYGYYNSTKFAPFSSVRVENVPEHKVNSLIENIEIYIKSCKKLYETNKVLVESNAKTYDLNQKKAQDLINFLANVVGLRTSKMQIVRGKNKSVSCDWVGEIRERYAEDKQNSMQYIDSAIRKAEDYIKELKTKKLKIEEEAERKKKENAKLVKAINFLQEQGVSDIDMSNPILQAKHITSQLRAQGKITDLEAFALDW